MTLSTGASTEPEVTLGLRRVTGVAEAVWDPIGTLLEDAAREWAVGCLVEDPHGRIVCHALTNDVPEAALRAVLTRSSGPLHQAASRLRTVGMLTGGPLLSGSVDGASGAVTVAPLVGAGHLWLFGDREPDPRLIEALVEDLSPLLYRIAEHATVPGLYETLHGRGSDVAPLDSWVAVLRQQHDRSWEPLTVHRTMIAALTRCSAREITVTHEHCFVVLRDAHASSATHRVNKAVDALTKALGLSVVGAIAPVTSGLSRARQTAERSLLALAVPGRCVTVDEARSYATIRQVIDLVQATPTDSPNPVADLVARGDHLVLALSTWLDCHGDIPAAAMRLNLHTNTLRYRIKTARKLVPADLDDPIARLEVHLRLLALSPNLRLGGC